jgi:hypothetical protein
VSDISNTSNRRPADKLHDIRQSIAELESEEQRLRSWLLANPADRVGDSHMALIRPQQRRRVDMKPLIGEIGLEVVGRHTTTRAIDAVYLSAVASQRRAG